MGSCCSSREKIPPRGIVTTSDKTRKRVEELERKSKEIEKMVLRVIGEGKPWTDPDFQPNMKSLFNPSIDEGDASLYRSLAWKRAKDIYKQPKVFSGGIEPNDINQGSLGDCYFLAVLSSLAEFPERIMDMFVTQSINDAGIYLVKFFINGTEYPVVVDDYFPVHPNGHIAFASSKDDELWVSILEKAWAKLHGTYARTEGGLPSFAASHLVGVPSESRRHDSIEDVDKFFQTLSLADHRDFTMMAASHGQGEITSDEGVVSGHAYSLISIHQFKHKGEMVRLLKLRNPWGTGEWQGKWSDNWEGWTPSLRAQVGSEVGDDGAFFIQLEDYMQHFAWTSICVENNNSKYVHSSLYHSFGSKDTSDIPQAFFKFRLDRAVDFKKFAFAISVLQQGDRLSTYRLRDQNRFDPSDFNIVLMTAQGKFISSSFGNSFMYSLLNDDVVLERGDYYFMVDPIWNESAELNEAYKDVLVDVYAPEIVDLELVEDATGIHFLEMALKDAAQTRAPESSKSYHLEDDPDYGTDVYRVQDIECIDCWYGFIYTKNDSQYPLREIILPQLDNLEVIWPSNVDEDGTINLDIKPKSDHIIILRRVGADCQFGMKYMTHPRPLSDSEIIAETQKVKELNYFGDYNVYYKLLNKEVGACFWFQNDETDKNFKTTFELQLQNL